jgi:hypothetical protein
MPKGPRVVHATGGSIGCSDKRAGSSGRSRMALSVIGAGVGRTGTLSLKLALERLGLGPCYHMREVFESLDTHVPLWDRAADVRMSIGMRSLRTTDRL